MLPQPGALGNVLFTSLTTSHYLLLCRLAARKPTIAQRHAMTMQEAPAPFLLPAEQKLQRIMLFGCAQTAPQPVERQRVVLGLSTHLCV